MAETPPPPTQRPRPHVAVNAKQGARQVGPRVLDDTARSRLERQCTMGGLRGARARFLLGRDDTRRRNSELLISAAAGEQFDRPTLTLTTNGYAGRNGGRMSAIARPPEWRATTAQIAGLWPWTVGAGAPLIGTPLGPHLRTGAPVCFDPMNWFTRGSFLTAPSLFVLGLNGFGKSTLVRRIVLGGIAQGVTPLILADVKPDYRPLVELAGGQIIDIGYGHGCLNPLDNGVMGQVLTTLTRAGLHERARNITQELQARQIALVAGLIELVRGHPVADYEEALIATALRQLYTPEPQGGRGFAIDRPPILTDLLEVIVTGSEELRLDAAADTEDAYRATIVPLRQSLRRLTNGPFGEVFNGHTSTAIDFDSVAVCIDVSNIPTGDRKLKAAAMLACWAAGFSAIEALNTLTDAGLADQRYFQVVMDELWQVLALGDFMIERVDELTRLQRGLATALIMISHTIKDLQALSSAAAVNRALGFLERARAKVFGALPADEVERLDSIVPFTASEKAMVTSWSAPQALTGEPLPPGQPRPAPPGTGKFLLKIGEDRRPGIPFSVELSATEIDKHVHETNTRFHFRTSTDREGHTSGIKDGRT
ncbi:MULTISPECIES: hypothetical protein [Nocardia]|uniref:Type IV secretory pathway, VirB4 components n=1 Tax=Nocardia africana TaxID=134964 RepID=A0A378WIH0_9NOCA|nr:hypothetical protein [Nocardia africana]MCC3317978.1 hypothetical protein [Nocardia africana]SUA40702.1 Type IV secretory pathway, VirB4 components [Nocardia africana]